MKENGQQTFRRSFPFLLCFFFPCLSFLWLRSSLDLASMWRDCLLYIHFVSFFLLFLCMYLILCSFLRASLTGLFGWRTNEWSSGLFSLCMDR